MQHSAPNTQYATASIEHTGFSRRNLPRASHACTWCRLKKARCDQKQPCVNCLKHSVDCTYDVRRRNRRKPSNRARDGESDDTEITHRRLSSPTAAPRAHSEIHVTSRPRQTPGHPPANTQEFSPQTVSVTDSDTVGDVNPNTRGTEFYGTSSNFVLLNQLFAFAQKHLPTSNCKPVSNLTHINPDNNEQSYVAHVDHPSQHGEQDIQSEFTTSPQGHTSVINLLSNEEALSPPSRSSNEDRLNRIQNEGQIPAAPSSRSGYTGGNYSDPTSLAISNQPTTISPTRAVEIRLEREYVGQFLNNLHHLHPMLSPTQFLERCNEVVWRDFGSLGRVKNVDHFLALFNIVVAVGALVAGRNVDQAFEKDIHTCMEQSRWSGSSQHKASSQALSRLYFHRSKNLLGDVFEVCSLESAQTLLFMSLYCQNSQKPHACYMYCGQAVRTALAIGLGSEITSRLAEDNTAIRRTWWCIYSHEIDMSCSPGRRDSLGKPQNYQTPLPLIRDRQAGVLDSIETEDCSVTMINEMVHFAAILRRVSKRLYHDSKGLTLLQKSTIATELEGLLDEWKGRLPDYLDFGIVSLREEEWAAKQKLVLHLRYLHAKILVHRPFLNLSTSEEQLDRSKHVESCLKAAQETIRILFDAYAHRYYFRTWWYNASYTLHAAMTISYMVITRATPCSADLVEDVTKARSILQSMDEVSVARRSAKLLSEMLELLKRLQHRQSDSNLPGHGTAGRTDDEPRDQEAMDDLTSIVDFANLQTMFPSIEHGVDSGQLFASFIDPSLLRDFTAEPDVTLNQDASNFSFDNIYSSDWAM